MHYTRLRNDDEGVPHFEDVEPAWEAVVTAPGYPPIHVAPIGDTGVRLGRLTSGWRTGMHPSPEVEWWVQTAGEVAVTTSRGDRRVLRPGDVYCFENIDGEGHEIEVLSDVDVEGVFFVPPAS